uniref:Uncharacterized protein n=1 Tax=Guillardia theta TaxID=55529 RepID=A0A7S4UWJ4_GUITH|mmetsp:Transcript_49950/g.156347  ORF Transcript_49950/g.156347 Transcript_49950/m.156347 type:complete len:131 (+) Transcript_49950:774-1166(+)
MVEMDFLVPWAPEGTWAFQAHKDLEAWQDLMENQDREARRVPLELVEWDPLDLLDLRAHEGYKDRRDPLDRPVFPCEAQTAFQVLRVQLEARELQGLQGRQVQLDLQELLELSATSNNIIKQYELKSPYM